MNWEELESNFSRNGFPVAQVLDHARKLGQFRRDHPAVGAGNHQMLSESPYVFSRSLVSGDYSDRVVVGLDLEPGKKIMEVGALFEEGTQIFDYYSGSFARVKKGAVTFSSDQTIALLGQR
jgi:alpha-amylase